MNFQYSEVDRSWHQLFRENLPLIEETLGAIDSDTCTPSRERIFRAFQAPLDEIKVLIVGQDPYPAPGVADGLAFSSAKGDIPASLRNIYRELSSDIGCPIPTSGDLSRWMSEGVMLLNRSLTTEIGSSDAHKVLRWREFTFSVAQLLSERDVVAILWGKQAQELSKLFRYRIESTHPSPLSAYRGFFGSRPFSQANRRLQELGRTEINW